MQLSKFSDFNFEVLGAVSVSAVKDQSSLVDEADPLQAELSWLYMHVLDCIHSNPDISPWVVKVMKAQRSSPQHSARLPCYWFSIMSPVCYSNPVVSGDWSKAEQKGAYMYSGICPGDRNHGSLLEYLSALMLWSHGLKVVVLYCENCCSSFITFCKEPDILRGGGGF